MLARLFITALAAAYLLALPGCATASGATASTVSPDQQCRRMRGAAAGRGIGMTLGAVVLVGVVLVAIAGGGNPSFGGAGERDRAERRQARRAARAAACDAADAPAPSAPEGGATASSAALPRASAPSAPPAYETASDAPPPGVYDVPEEPNPSAISRAELHEAILPHVDALRACAPEAQGTLLMDARIDGTTGRVTGILLQGPIATSVPTVCVSLVTANIHVRQFEGVVDVRWAVRYPE